MQRIVGVDNCIFLLYEGVVLREVKHSDWFFFGWDFAIQTVSMGMVKSGVFFVFKSWQI